MSIEEIGKFNRKRRLDYEYNFDADIYISLSLSLSIVIYIAFLIHQRLLIVCKGHND